MNELPPGLAGFALAQQQGQQQQQQELQRAVLVQGLLAKLQADQRQRQYQSEVAAAGPAATQDQLARISARYAGPEAVMKAQQSSLDRQAAIDRQRENDALRLEQQSNIQQMTHQLRMAQLKTDQDRAAETARHNQVMEGLQRQIVALKPTADQPKPPAGYRATKEGNLEPIPGGPADLKIAGQLNQDTATLNTLSSNLDRLATAANEVQQHPGLAGITGTRGAFPNIPGSAAADAQAKLDTLKAQVGFGTLQEMRNASKSGGALGQVTEAEHRLLQNAIAALEKSQSKAQMAESLQKIKDYADAAKGRLREAYNLKHHAGAVQGEAPPQTQPAAPQPQQSPNSGWSITPVK